MTKVDELRGQVLSEWGRDTRNEPLLCELIDAAREEGVAQERRRCLRMVRTNIDTTEPTPPKEPK